MQDLTPTQITIIVAVIVVVVGAIAFVFLQKRRTEKLRQHFGPEYDRAMAEGGNRRVAEQKLEERAARVKKLHITPLSAEDRDRFTVQWNRVQARFVDAPAGAVAEADQLIGDLMATCGYPMGDFEQRAADISVDHPAVTQNYRAAHDIALRQAKGQAGTEDLRRAMIHYRALFDELVGVRGATAPAAEVPVVDRKPVATAERAADYPPETVRVRRG